MRSFCIDCLWFRQKFLNDQIGKYAVSNDKAGWVIRGATAFLFAMLFMPLLRGRPTRVRYIRRFGSTGLTIGWGAIEKFTFPHRTYPLLTDQPFLLMGMNPEF